MVALQTERNEPNSIVAWLTVERTAWIGIGVVAALLRLAGLGAQPFLPAEATQAVAALAGAGLSGTGVSPLLLSLQKVSFLVTQSGEELARLWPALAGIALVLLAYQLRADLGRVGALGAALLLAISPALVLWSRSATGESFALLAAMVLVVALCRARRGERWTLWMAAGLALLVLSSPLAYSVLLVLTPLALLALLRRPDADGGANAAMLFLILVALGATAFFFNPGGFASLAELPASWLAGITSSVGYSPFWLTAQATLSQLLLVVLGAAGMVVGLRRRDWLAAGLGLWLALGLLLLWLRAGRTAADAALLALPLALLGGLAVEALVRHFDLADYKAEAAVLITACLVTLSAAGIWLGDYVASWDGQPRSVFLFSAIAAIVVAVGIAVVFAVLFDRRMAWQAGAIAALIALSVLTLSATFADSHSHDATRWGAPLSSRGAPDGANLTDFLQQLARARGSDLRDLPVTLVVAPGAEPAPLLRWYARGAVVRTAAGAVSSNPDEVFISLASDPPPSSSGEGAPLAGRSFRISESWSPAGLRGGPLWRWLVYREHDGLDNETRAVVWVPG